MACRIQNLSEHRLALDLRGGDLIYLRPGETSRPLREELLYGHIHLPRWLAQGLVRQIDVKMSEVFEHERKAAATGEALAGVEADGKAGSTAEGPAGGGGAEKPKPRGQTKDSSAKPDK
jgi:hypothetical protein